MTSPALLRLTALAGLASAVGLVFNFLRRAEVVPDVAATRRWPRCPRRSG